MMIELILIVGAIAIGYVLGSIPTAVWIGKYFYQIDVREHGSKNAGATNTFRVLGKKPGIIVLVIDVIKGIVASIFPIIFGDFFEHFIILEVRAYNHYFRKNLDLCYWRSTSQFEVDLLVSNELAIEIKATSNPSDKHLKGLRALKEEKLIKSYFLVCNCEQERLTEDKISILPWKVFLDRLWKGNLI
jgi:hypothetical protein